MRWRSVGRSLETLGGPLRPGSKWSRPGRNWSRRSLLHVVGPLGGVDSRASTRTVGRTGRRQCRRANDVSDVKVIAEWVVTSFRHVTRVTSAAIAFDFASLRYWSESLGA